MAYSGQPWRLWCGDGSIDDRGAITTRSRSTASVIETHTEGPIPRSNGNSEGAGPMTGDEHRALALLADSGRNGTTNAILAAYGFTAGMVTSLGACPSIRWISLACEGRIRFCLGA